LHFKGAFIDAIIHNARKALPALVEERRRSKVWIASINGWAAGQQRMSEGRTAVIL
jgi:hypothetical protein